MSFQVWSNINRMSVALSFRIKFCTHYKFSVIISQNSMTVEAINGNLEKLI